MLKNIRSAEGFYAHVQKLERAGIPGRGRTKLKAVEDLLRAYADLRTQLHRLEQTHARKAPVVHFINDLRGQLNTLVPKSFIRIYDDARLERLMRYLQAMEKDRTKARPVEEFAKRLDRLIQSLSPQSSREKRRAVEDFFWMLEEYKISVFAQEIKTSRPVSAKRLTARIAEIEGMV